MQSAAFGAFKVVGAMREPHHGNVRGRVSGPPVAVSARAISAPIHAAKHAVADTHRQYLERMFGAVDELLAIAVVLAANRSAVPSIRDAGARALAGHDAAFVGVAQIRRLHLHRRT